MADDGVCSPGRWTAQRSLWKSRLPLLALPLLSGLRQLSWESAASVPPVTQLASWEPLLICAIVAGTGYFRLPFSAAWWLTLVAALAFETRLLLGVATVLSLSVLLGWYGVRLAHPQAVSALWGGVRCIKSGRDDINEVLWQAWDLVVHLLPAGSMLVWHGPRLTAEGGVSSGSVDAYSAVLALPMNVLWLWALGQSFPPRAEGGGWLRRRRIWPWGMRLEDTDAAYAIELPGDAWRRVYASHWFACAAWAACLLLPTDVLLAYGIFMLMGFTWQPFTTGWWICFILALCTPEKTVFRGIVACNAATVSMGFYGLRMLVPHFFESLVNAWLLVPAKRWAPSWAEALDRAKVTTAFFLAVRIGDLFLHLVPTTTAVILFAPCMTATAALVSVPCNLLYWFATGYPTLAATNAIYGIEPDMPRAMWRFVYGSHWVFCSGLACAGVAWRGSFTS